MEDLNSDGQAPLGCHVPDARSKIPGGGILEPGKDEARLFGQEVFHGWG